MQDFVRVSKEIEEFLEAVTEDNITEACKMMDEFWKAYCEVTVTFFVLSWTLHNHAAKGAWGRLDHILRQRLKDIKHIT